MRKLFHWLCDKGIMSFIFGFGGIVIIAVIGVRFYDILLPAILPGIGIVFGIFLLCISGFGWFHTK